MNYLSQNNQMHQDVGVKSVKKLTPCYLSVCTTLLMLSGMSTWSYAEEEQPLKVYASLAPITVYAEREHQSPQSRTIINRQNLDQTGANDMASIVKYMPLVNAPFSVAGSGTFFDGTGTSSYNIRGVDANRIGLDVDGIDIAAATVSSYVPPKSMSQRGAGRDYIDPEMFSAVDIVAGGTDVSTDGLGGRVSFKNKSPEDYLSADKKFAANFKQVYSSADQAWLSSFTAAAGHDTAQALVTYAHRDGHETKPNSSTKAFPADWNSDAVLGKFVWDLADQHKLSLTADYYRKKSDTRGISPDLFSTYKSDAQQWQDIQRQTFSLDDVYRPQDFILFDQLTTKLWYQKSENDTQTSFMNSATVHRDFSTTYKERSLGIKIDAQREFAQQQLKYGVLIDQKKYSSTKIDLRDGVPNLGLYQGGYLLDSELKRYSVYVSDQFDLTLLDREFRITPSLGFERQEFRPESGAYQEVKARDFNYAAPSLSLSYQLTPNNYSYAKYTRGTRVPSPTEIGGLFQTTVNNPGYIVVGNSNLDPERSDAFEVGLKNTAIDGVKLDLTGFYSKYKDFIDYYNYGSTTEYPYGYYRAENLANVNIWGGEFSAHIDLGQFMPQVQGLSLALVAGKSKGTSKNKNGDKGGVNSVQPAKGSLTLAYDDADKVFGLGMTVTAVDSRTASRDVSMYQEQNQYQRVAGYSVIDLSTYWNLNRYTKLNLALNNILDKRYWDYATVGTLSGIDQATMIDRAAEPGRNIVASVEFKY